MHILQYINCISPRGLIANANSLLSKLRKLSLNTEYKSVEKVSEDKELTIVFLCFNLSNLNKSMNFEKEVFFINMYTKCAGKFHSLHRHICYYCVYLQLTHKIHCHIYLIYISLSSYIFIMCITLSILYQTSL